MIYKWAPHAKKAPNMWKIFKTDFLIENDGLKLKMRKNSLECLSWNLNNKNHWHLFRVYKYVNTTQHNQQYVCLLLWGLSSHFRIFHSYVDITFTSEGLQILTYAQYSWPLSIKGSIACYTYCDTGHNFKMVNFENPLHSQL